MAAPVTDTVFFGDIAFELFDREPGHEFLIRRLFLFGTSGTRIPAYDSLDRRIFLGWILLDILTLGILGLFYVNPYIFSTHAAFYEEVKALNALEATPKEA